MGIQLYQLDDAANLPTQILAQLPVYVRVLDYDNLVYMVALAEAGKDGIKVDTRMPFGFDVVKATSEAILNLGPQNFLDFNELVLNVDDKVGIKFGKEEGNQVAVKDVQVRCKLKLSTFVGKLSDFPGAKSFVSVDNGPKMLVIPLDNPEELIEKLPNLYTKTGVLPGEKRPAIFVLIVPSNPEFFQTAQSFNMMWIKGGKGLSLSKNQDFNRLMKLLDNCK